MTEQEAIEIIEQLPVYRYEADTKMYQHSDIFLALSKGVEALKKQIAKKPLLRLCRDCQKDCIECDRYEDRCPNCNGGLYDEGGKTYKYCPDCGQLLDWGNEDAE